MKIIDGGVTAAEGFQAAGLAAGIKKGNTKDMALVYSEKPCVAAGTFTTNVVKAAPVKWDQNVVYHSPAAQAVIINSGIANACTGVAIQAPLIPKIRGRINNEITIKTNVLQKEISADTFPLDSAVKNPEDVIFMPLNRKLMENSRNPTEASSQVP